MRKTITMPLAVGLAAAWLILGAAALGAVPVPEGRPGAPDQWEYCELVYQARLAGGFAAKGGAAQPAAPAMAQQTSLRLVTAEVEIEGTSWDDMAMKLKALPAKMGTTAAMHRIRVLNRLGAEGWELVSHQKGTAASSAESWTFRRRIR